MRALRGYLLLGVLVFAVVIAATLPARVVVPFLPTRLALRDVSGSIWEGAAAQVNLDGAPLGQLQWHLSPLEGLRARLAGDVTITRPDGHLSGHLSVRRDCRWTCLSTPCIPNPHRPAGKGACAAR